MHSPGVRGVAETAWTSAFCPWHQGKFTHDWPQISEGKLYPLFHSMLQHPFPTVRVPSSLESVTWLGQVWFTRQLSIEPVQWNVCGFLEMGICRGSDPQSSSNSDNRSLLKMVPGYCTLAECSLGDNVRSFSKARLLCRFQVT